MNNKKSSKAEWLFTGFQIILGYEDRLTQSSA